MKNDFLQQLAQELWEKRDALEKERASRESLDDRHREISEQIHDTLWQLGQGLLATEWRENQQALLDIEYEIKSLKDAEKEAKDALTISALADAHTHEKLGQDPFGRTLHPNISIIKSTQIVFDKDNFPKIVEWLVASGKQELIQIVTKGELDFFKERQKNDSLPRDAGGNRSLIQILVVPGVRIDAHTKWSTPILLLQDSGDGETSLSHDGANDDTP